MQLPSLEPEYDLPHLPLAHSLAFWQGEPSDPSLHTPSESEPEERASRLSLCALTARTLSTGLELLGIEAPERM